MRMRRGVAVLLLAITPILAGCTPGEIEMSVNQIAGSFEQGGTERGLISAVFVLQMAIPVVRMRLGSAFGL